MGNLSNRAIHSIFGCPTEDNTRVITVTAADSGVSMETEFPGQSGNEIYRLIATEDCHVTVNSGTIAATTGAPLLAAGVPEMFSTTGKHVTIRAIRVDTDGSLYITKMITRGN